MMRAVKPSHTVQQVVGRVSLGTCIKQQIADCINCVMHMVLPRIGYTANTWELSMICAAQTSAGQLNSTPNPVQTQNVQLCLCMATDELYLPETEPCAYRNSILELMQAIDDYIPDPTRALDRPFSLPVEDVFSIQGRGTVVTGRIEQGIVKVGEEIEIIGIQPATKTIVTGKHRALSLKGWLHQMLSQDCWIHWLSCSWTFCCTVQSGMPTWLRQSCQGLACRLACERHLG